MFWRPVFAAPVRSAYSVGRHEAEPNTMLAVARSNDRTIVVWKLPVLVTIRPPMVAAKLLGINVKLARLKFAEKCSIP